MKAIKVPALILIAVLLAPLICTLLLGISLGCSVLSPAYADTVFGKSFSDKSIAAMASDSSAVPEALGALLKSKDGAAWFKSELPKLARGSFRYFTASGGKLPVVNIKQLKTSLVDAYVDQALSQGGGDSSTVKALVRSELGIDTMKDTLDLNALAQNAYGTKDNPVSGFGPMLSGVTTNLFLLNITLVVLLSALVFVIAFRTETVLRWLGGAFTVSGAICLIPSAAALIFNGALKNQLTLSLGMDAGSGLFFIRDWVMSFLVGAALFLVIGGAIVLIAGILMQNAAKKRNGRGAHSSKRKADARVGTRAAAAILIVAAIPAALYFFGKTVWQATDKYDTIVLKADRSENKMSFGRALDKTLNCKVFGMVLK